MEHVITVSLVRSDVSPAFRAEALPLLPPERRRRVEACVSPAARDRVLMNGLLLRHVLGIARDGLLRFGEFGKPCLPGGPFFSLSAAAGLSALAVSDTELGLDLERLRPCDFAAAERLFCPEELEWLKEAPSPLRYLTLWTRLESALKAEGTGFAQEGRRSFSLLTDGAPWFFDTREAEGCVLSCASGVPFRIELQWPEPEALLL